MLSLPPFNSFNICLSVFLRYSPSLLTPAPKLNMSLNNSVQFLNLAPLNSICVICDFAILELCPACALTQCKQGGTRPLCILWLVCGFS